MYKQYPSIYIDEGLDRIYRTWDPWVNRVTHTPPCTRRGGCLGLEGVGDLGLVWFAIPLLIGGGIITTLFGGAMLSNQAKQWLLTMKGQTPDQVKAEAFKKLNRGEITLREYQHIMDMIIKAEGASSGGSGMAQVGNIAKWVGIAAVAGLGAVVLMPIVERLTKKA